MSILIKGMKIPKSCEDCQWHLDFYIEDRQVGGLCTITEKDDKENDCPLIEIVRCGECTRSGTDGENTFCMWLGALRQPTDFCSYGERRDDEVLER